MFIGVSSSVFAQSADELRARIDARNAEIKKIEAEIAAYRKEIEVTGREISSLSSKIKELTATSKKLSADIRLTQAQIDSSELKIEELSRSIRDKDHSLERSRLALAAIVRDFDERKNLSVLESFIAHASLSDLWVEIDTLEDLSRNLDAHVADVRLLKTQLESAKNEQEHQKRSLGEYRANLSDQHLVAENTKKEQDRLLSQTKNKESTYKQLVAEREARKRAFEQELANLESQLKIVLDISKLPSQGTRALGWPLNSVIITQQFGDTAFSRSNPGVYSGKGHNGIDLGVSVGEPVLSAEAGTVLGTGDTDTTCAGASYGKWILIRHTNGLSTLYAHLSTIRVSAGQTVGRGETIGLSGNTGYSTGPHLHFTVFASQGVEIRQLPSRGCAGRIYTIPVAPYASYLNPLLYL